MATEQTDEFATALAAFLKDHPVDSADKLTSGISLIGKSYTAVTVAAAEDPTTVVPPFSIIAWPTGDTAKEWTTLVPFWDPAQAEETPVDTSFLDTSTAVLSLEPEAYKLDGATRQQRCFWVNGYKVCY